MAARASKASKAAAKGKAADYPLSYADYLDSRLDDSKRKGERTRERLRAAAARLLGDVGYRDLRVTDINEAAGVSNALFYVYFDNKEAITKEVLTGYLDFLGTFRERDANKDTSEKSIYYGNLRYAELFKANAGLMRCVFQVADEFPEFAAEWHAWNSRWVDRAVRSLGRDEALDFRSHEDAWMAVATLGMMVDALLTRAMVEKSPEIGGEAAANDVEGLALLLTRLWVRGLYGRDMRWTPDRARKN